MLPYTCKLKNNFQLEEERIGIIFFDGISDPPQFKIEQNVLV